MHLIQHRHLIQTSIVYSWYSLDNDVIFPYSNFNFDTQHFKVKNAF
jgi:hypothetical protein